MVGDTLDTKKKLFKCKVWNPALIHFECATPDEALNLVTRFFSDTEVSVEYIAEVPHDSIAEELIYGEQHVPKLTIN